MSGNRNKEAAQWFYTMIQRQTPTAGNREETGTVYRDEAIRPRVQPQASKLPSLLRAARSLESGTYGSWQSRELIFIKQAKLLAGYEDDCPFSGNLQRYYPTYQSLTDQELRGYFSWRTRLRRGDMQKAPPAFAFLYIYELLNQIGVEDPMEGYRKLKAFEADYGCLDDTVLPYLKRWLFDYVLYYNLPTDLLQDSEQAVFDRNLLVLQNIQQYDVPQILEAVKYFAPRWLGRSRFYAQHQEDMDTVIAGVLRGIHDHHAARCKKTMVEQYFGPRRVHQINLFDTAVFLDKARGEDREVTLDPLCVYRCRRGLWSAEKYSISSRSNPKLEDLMKTVDSVMREMYHDRHPVKAVLDTKWILKLIEEQVHALLDGKQAAEAKKLRLDYGKLDKIRSDAAVTRDKLIVDEEENYSGEQEQALSPEPDTAPSAGEAPDIPLTQQECRFLRCLLYGGDLSWVRQEGLLLSVLVDSINEKLYDAFQDTVLTSEDRPAVIEDYLDELKEMVPE